MTGHTGTWQTRGKDKGRIQWLSVGMIFSAIAGWFAGLTEGVAIALITNAVILTGAVEINHTRAKVADDKAKRIPDSEK